MSHATVATVFTLALWLTAAYDVYVYSLLHNTVAREPYQSVMQIQTLEEYLNVRLVFLAVLTCVFLTPQFNYYSEGIPFYYLIAAWLLCWWWLKNSAHHRLVIELWEDYFKREDAQ